MTVRIGHATYTNKITGEKYKMSFDLLCNETELGKAWDLVSLAVRKNGWRAADVAVKAGDWEQVKRLLSQLHRDKKDEEAWQLANSLYHCPREVALQQNDNRPWPEY